ncbi:MAG: WXG100 family type VII secretion target [Pseudonocardiaceae bacterium]|nr:WXG100 family type VII secretion target [Pseudonocardiaceae bacterium]
MSGPIKVTFGEIANAQGSIASTSKLVQTKLDDLKSTVQRLASGWQGAASESYQVKQAQWDKSAADLNQVLHQISVAVGNANEGYQNTEGKNTQRFGG